MFNGEHYLITPEQKVELKLLRRKVESRRFEISMLSDQLRMARRNLRESEEEMQSFLDILLDTEPGIQVLEDG